MEKNQKMTHMTYTFSEDNNIDRNIDAYSYINNEKNESKKTSTKNISLPNNMELFMGLPYFNEFDVFCYPKFKIDLAQKLPVKTLMNDGYIYVNSKQYYRILKRREMRLKLRKLYNTERDKNYIHESRHQHALKRRRSKEGRFLSKTDNLNINN